MTETPSAEELRAIPLEQMRSWYADWVERSSIRSVSMGIGLGRTTLHKFVVGGTNPHPRVRRLLALAYVRGQSGGADEEAAQTPLARDEDSPGAALARLARGRGMDSQEVSEVRLALVRITELLPPQARRDFYEQVLDTAERVYTDAGQIPPATLMQLRVWLR